MLGADAITNPVVVNKSFTLFGTTIAGVLQTLGLEFSGPVTLASGIKTSTVTGSGPLFKISGVIAGSGGLNKAGVNTLFLSANNTYTDSTIVSAGTLALTNAGSVAASSDITVLSGATLDVSG